MERKDTSPSATTHSAAPEHGSVDELVDHIIEHIHAPTRAEIPRLLSELQAALDVMEGSSPELEEVNDLVGEIAREQLEHMEKEETVLFPWIRSGRGKNAAAPIRAITSEHAETGHKLARVRELRLQLRGLATAQQPSGSAQQPSDSTQQSSGSTQLSPGSTQQSPDSTQQCPPALERCLGTLESFEARLVEHMRLEDDVLFLRALQGW